MKANIQVGLGVDTRFILFFWYNNAYRKRLREKVDLTEELNKLFRIFIYIYFLAFSFSKWMC